jgi:hypothetical protein
MQAHARCQLRGGKRAVAAGAGTALTTDSVTKEATATSAKPGCYTEAVGRQTLSLDATHTTTGS